MRKFNTTEPQCIKNDTNVLFYWVFLLLIIAGAAIIRWRLLSMPLERDEGEYAYIAQMMLKGVPPYLSAYTMKMPGIDVIYALIFLIFGQSCTAIHLGLLIVNAVTIFLVFLIAKRLFGAPPAVIAAGAYAVMSMSIPVFGLAANTEHFVVLPALIGVILLIRVAEKRNLLIIFYAAFLFGLAFIIKQHGIFFGIFASLYLLYGDFRKRPVQWKKLIISQLVFIIGAVLPFALACLLLWRAGAFDKFWFWTFTYAGRYVNLTALETAGQTFLIRFRLILNPVIPIWFLALFGWLMIIFNVDFRKKASFVLSLTVFSFFCVCPGLYFREHYFIFLLPAVSLAAGGGFDRFCSWTGINKSISILRIFTVFIALFLMSYSLIQQRTFLFEDSPAEVCRKTYWPNPFAESLPIAEYIQANTDANDTIAIIGSEPQIYFYSGRRAATRYIYTYPLTEIQPYAAEMQNEMINEIDKAKPKFFLTINILPSWSAQKESNQTILKWANYYSTKFYNLTGLIEIGPQKTNYLLDLKSDRPLYDKYWIAIFKRKQ